MLRKYLFVTLLVFITSAHFALAQKYAHQYKTLVITQKDSLYDARIKKGVRKTNAYQLTFIHPETKKKMVLPPADVISYEIGDEYYSSKTIASVEPGEPTVNRLVSIMLSGPATLFYSKEKNGLETYYFLRKDSLLVPLEFDEEKLVQLFSQELDRYQEYAASQPKYKLKPNIRRVHEHLIGYNQLIIGENYGFVRYKKNDYYKLGVSGGVGMASINLQDNSEYENAAFPFAGLVLRASYSNRVSLEAGLSYYQINLTSPQSAVNFNGINATVNFKYKVLQYNALEMFLSGGVLVAGNIKGSYEVYGGSDKVPAVMQGGSAGPQAGLSFGLKRKHMINLFYSQYSTSVRSPIFSYPGQVKMYQLQYVFFPTR